MLRRPDLARVLALVLVSAGLAACQSSGLARLEVSNQVDRPLDVRFEPQFATSRRQSEEVRSLKLAPGEKKPIELAKGVWEVRATDDDGNSRGDKLDFQADGTVSFEAILPIRYSPAGGPPPKEK